MFEYTSPPFCKEITPVNLVICEKCALREYYGSKGKMTKRYQRDKELERLFGVQRS